MVVRKRPADPKPRPEGERIDHVVAGVSCPTCGGRKLRKVWTRRRGGLTLRLRECADCSTRVRTSERVVG